MAKIQNPQNEKGEKLATEIMVNNTITECLAPLENRLEDSFENINSGDQFISIDKINADKNEEGDFFKTTISANVTESLDDIDKTSAETNKLVTSTVLKEVKDSISDKFDDALDDHINDNDKHVTEEDREKWDKADTAIQSISAGNYINISETNTISVTNVTSNIAESDDNYLTTAASIREYVKDINDNNTISDIIWNLNDLLVSCINDVDKSGVVWVQELLRANARSNGSLITIIDYETVYNTSDLSEATERWIDEAITADKSLSTQLAFRQDSFMTNQLFRLFFYNLDNKFGKTYGSSDSISKKYMKRGLTFKYLAKVEGNPVSNYPNEGFGKPRFKYITLRYRAKTIDGSDKEKEIDWEHTPTIQNTVNSGSTADTFQMAKAWDIIDSEEYSTPDSDISSIIEETISEEPSNWDIESSFTDSATNVYDFTCNSPFSGILTEVRLHCAPAGKSETTLSTYLEIRQGDKILARSTNSQEHGQGNILRFNFDNVLINYNERYGFYVVNANGSKASSSCLALKKKAEVPEVTNLNVMVSGYADYTPHFGFTYYKSNRKIINSSLDKLDCNLVYDISYNYSNTNNIQSVRNRSITFADGSTSDFPVNKITHAKYAFRTKSGTTPVLTEFNLRDIDGGKPGSGYDSAYYYERDVRNSSYDEDAGGNIETLGNLINGDGMFIRSGITIFNDDLSCLIRARQMFTNSSLTTFRSALPSLTFADRMFLGTELTEFKIKLPNLSSAECMFRLCKNLEFVDTCLPNLTFAQGMFGYCTALKRIDLSPSSGANLYLADNMFTGCENLTSVKLNLEYLENAKDMFASGVYSNITYNAPLLDLSSVINIANTIKDWTNDYYTNKVHEIAIGINETSEIYNSGNSSYKQYIDQIADKNWKVSLYTSNSRQSPAFTIVKD